MSDRQIVAARAAKRAALRSQRRETETALRGNPTDPKRQLAKLDARLGKGVGAAKERARLTALLAK